MDRIDVFAMARIGARWQGSVDVAAMPRLCQGLLRAEGRLSYRCESFQDSRDRPSLRLEFEVQLALGCDRCGKELALGVRADRTFYFVATEGELAAIAIDDAPEEALLGSQRFDIAALVEDEAILQVPISPRHDDCGPDAAVCQDEGAKRPHPFAQLAGLRERLRRPAAPEAPALAGARRRSRRQAS